MVLNILVNTIYQGSLLNIPLYLTQKDKLQIRDVGLNFGFIGFVSLPSAYFYNKLLKSFREKLFPEFNQHQIRYFSLMYFVSKPTILFDAFFIHFLYYGFIGLSLFSLCQYQYTHKPKDESKQNLQNSLTKLIKFRFYISLISITFDVWFPQIEHWGKNFKEDPKQILMSKKFQLAYLLKQQIFNCIWSYVVISEYFSFCEKEY
ncbi:unnamed protein product [Paramecium pentaurelia]|uniref:Uncharacterized protein n=1 Tax=Paramecium pentaurelia TaxID=43138 RepID=A0A8S1SVN4_9CILI|nr:unnamed protein product [Paramecium pentaurelia]